MTGIYLITNKLNNKKYVGQARDIEDRWKRHIGRNVNSIIHNAIKKYGVDNFKFEVLEECKKEILLERELYYYNKYKPEYNMIVPIENPMNNEEVRKKHLAALNEESFKKRQSIIGKENWANMSHETKEKIIKNSHTKEAQRKRKLSTRTSKFRKQKSKLFKSLWEDENYRKKHEEKKIKILEEIRQRPDVRRKYSKNSKERWEDPIYREKVISQTAALKRKEIIISKDDFKKEFDSVSSAASWLSDKLEKSWHNCRVGISKVINGKHQTVYGFKANLK